MYVRKVVGTLTAQVCVYVQDAESDDEALSIAIDECSAQVAPHNDHRHRDAARPVLRLEGDFPYRIEEPELSFDGKDGYVKKIWKPRMVDYV